MKLVCVLRNSAQRGFTATRDSVCRVFQSWSVLSGKRHGDAHSKSTFKESQHSFAVIINVEDSHEVKQPPNEAHHRTDHDAVLQTVEAPGRSLTAGTVDSVRNLLVQE